MKLEKMNLKRLEIELRHTESSSVSLWLKQRRMEEEMMLLEKRADSIRARIARKKFKEKECEEKQ